MSIASIWLRWLRVLTKEVVWSKSDDAFSWTIPREAIERIKKCSLLQNGHSEEVRREGRRHHLPIPCCRRYLPFKLWHWVCSKGRYHHHHHHHNRHRHRHNHFTFIMGRDATSPNRQMLWDLGTIKKSSGKRFTGIAFEYSHALLLLSCML